MARRRHLPGLPALLRRLGRRRHRRPARHHRPPAATCAELGVDAVWLSPFYTVPAGRRRLRRGRLPRRRPALRHPRRLRRAARRGARAAACGSSSTWCPTTPPTSTAGSRRRWPPRPGSPGARSATSSATAGARTASCRRTTGSRVFGGPAWTRVTDPDGTPGQWYLHLFDTEPARPRTGSNPEVRDRVPGRAAVLARPRRRRLPGRRRARPDQGTPACRTGTRAAGRPDAGPRRMLGTGPMWDQDGVHEIYRAWRALLDSYPGDRILVAEAWVQPPSRLARYVRPGRDAPGVQLRLPATPPGPPPARARSSTPSLAANDAVGAPDHLGAVQPRRGAARLPARPPTPAAAAERHRHRRPAAGRGARPAPGPGRHPADAGPARLGLPLPGRGAGPARAHRRCPTSLRQDPTWWRSRAHRGAAGTAAGCRSRGRPTPRRTASARPTRQLAAAAADLGRVRRWTASAGCPARR